MVRFRKPWRVAFGAGLAAATAGVILFVSGAAVSATTTAVECAPVPNPNGTGYWTEFGDASWTQAGLLTSSKADATQANGVTCGGASVYGNSLPTSDPAQITSLSFDFDPSVSGASGEAPRIVVCFTGGTNCSVNAALAPTHWTAGVMQHVDGFAPGMSNTWVSVGGRCNSLDNLTWSQVVACHPGAQIEVIAIVNDGGSLYHSGEYVLLNNMTVNNVVAHDQPPVLGQQAEIAPLTGSIMVRQPGSKHYVKAKTIMPLRYGASVHATGGRVQVIAAKPGKTYESGEFYDGGFNLSQGMNGIVQAQLTSRPSCPAPPAETARAGIDSDAVASDTLASAAKSKGFSLWGHVKGNFRTRGNYGSASVRGTIWFTQNQCGGTFFHVVRGVLRIRAFAICKAVTLTTGHSYLAPSQPPDTFDNDGDYNGDVAASLIHARKCKSG